jgi:signal transduction histidine kinase
MSLAMLLLAALTSAMFALCVFAAAERMERSVLNRHLRSEFDMLAQSAAERDGVDTVRSALLLGFVGRENPDVPAELARLPVGGYHDVRLGHKAYQVYVGESGGQRITVAYDITEWEALERPVIYTLVAGVLLSSLLAVWVGSWAAGQVIAPVTRLAERLKSLDPKERSVRLASDFEGAEVSMIAEAFDRYMERLDGFVERERLFTSAAAHELRTPLAVIQGATEVLLEQPDLSTRVERAARRIARAVGEMRGFSEALLFLSREPRIDGADRKTCELGRIVGELVEDYRGLVDAGCVRLAYHVANELVLDVPPALPAMVVANLLRNAIENTSEGHIHIELDGRILRVEDTGRGIPERDLGAVFDRDFSTKPGGGMGLNLAKRICERFGWRLRIRNAEGEGTIAEIEF